MENNLKVKGVTNFMGMELPNIYGGFGENKKCILTKTVAEIHEVDLKRINELIKRNRDEFEDRVDIIDLKQTVAENDRSENLVNMLLEIGYSSQNIKVSNNIYLLSEQGYMALVMLMRTDKAKEIRKRLRREYFAMKEIINSDEQLKKELAYKLLNGGIDSIEAHKQLVAIEVRQAEGKVVEKLQPKIDLAEKFTNCKDSYDVGKLAKVLNIKNMGRNNLFKWMRDKEILRYNNEPYQKYIEYFRVTCANYNGQTTYKTWITPKGIIYIYKRLVKDGKLIQKSKEEILEELNNLEIVA